MQRRTFLKASALAAATGAAAGAATSAFAAPAPIANPSGSQKYSETIEKARAAAREVLKPTPAQLQHGLELHAASVVVESYGFSPRSALDVDALNKAVESGASPLELSDLREEMGMTGCVAHAHQQAQYKEAWEAAGVTCILQNAGEECQAPLRILRRLARFTYVCDRLRDFVFKAVTPDDILAAKQQGRHCLYFSSNAVPMVEQWVSAPSELELLRVFFQLGTRMMHMTYNRRNMLGDGCAEPANAGLSDFGRMAVAEMNRIGIIPDPAHSGWQTSLETAQVSERPIMISHSVCDALNHHCRAKPDNVIKAVCDKGGVMGICLIGGFLGGSGDIAAVLDHIDYVVKRFGPDHAAIGMDIGYSCRWPDEAKKATTVPRGRARWENFWPKDSRTGRSHPSLAWTNWPMLTVGMVQRGYSDQDIQKILGGNVLRVARETWKAVG